MTNEVNLNEINTRIYKFIAQNGGIKSADGNGDSIVIKGEFEDFMANFDWTGVDKDNEKRDIINRFWNDIDKNQNDTTIGNTGIYDSNALNPDEMKNVETTIQVFQALEEYIAANVTAPSVLNNPELWVKSVTESLTNHAKTFIKEGGQADGLAAYLNPLLENIKRTTTADRCAQEYIEEIAEELVNTYGYKVNDDNVLKGIIDQFVKTLGADATDDEIQEKARDIVDAYFATAGRGEENDVDLADYGYKISNKSKLNDLQIAILQKGLQDYINADETMKSKYEANKEMFDTALAEFLKTVNFGDFENVKENVWEQFEASKPGKTLLNKLTTKELLTDPDFTSVLSETLGGDTLSNKISNNAALLPTVQTILTEALIKTENGDFNVEGEYNEQKVIDWFIEKISAKLNDIVSDVGGYDDMKLTELNNVYSKCIEHADSIYATDPRKSLDEVKQAAIGYCKAIAGKGAPFIEAIKTVFGSEDYTSAINEMKIPDDIKAKINELKTKANELGDAKEMKLASSSWGTMPAQTTVDLNASRASAIQIINEYLQALDYKSPKGRAALTMAEVNLNIIFGSDDYASVINTLDATTLMTKMADVNRILNQNWSPQTVTTQANNIIDIHQGVNKPFSITPTFTNSSGNSLTISTDRITYKSSNDSIAPVDSNGNVTINGSTAGTFIVTLSVMVDGVEVGTNTITVNVIPKPSKGDIMNKGIYNGKTFADIINNNSETVCIKTFSKNTDLNGPIGEVQKIIENVAMSFKAVMPDLVGEIDWITTTLKNYYSAFMPSLQFGGDGTVEFTYVDASGNTQNASENYSGYTAKKEDHADNVSGWCGGSSSGIGTARSYAGKSTHAMWLDVGNIIDKFFAMLGIQ